MLKKDKIKIGLLLFSGLLLPLMIWVLPIAGGGSSLIFVLSVPITLGLSLIVSGYYWLAIKFNWDTTFRDVVYFTALIIVLFITFAWFPYK